MLNNGVHLGDVNRWTVSPVQGPADKTHLIIKPVDSGLATNLTIYTDRRTYVIDLTSRRSEYVPLLRFAYPAAQDKPTNNRAWAEYHAQSARETELALEVAPEQAMPAGAMDFRYRLSGCKRCAFLPERVWERHAAHLHRPAGTLPGRPAGVLHHVQNRRRCQRCVSMGRQAADGRCGGSIRLC